MNRIMLGRIALTIAIALATAAPVPAQWLVYRDPRIPRTADGRPNLSAPAPRMPDGKPDHREHHLVGTPAEELKSVKPVTLPANVLSQYVGSYDFRWPEQPTVASIWEVTMRDGMLFLAGGSLIPLSETQFIWGSGQRIRFEKDA